MRKKWNCYRATLNHFLVPGPNRWGENYSKCVGKHQSPIDIAEDNVQIVDFGDVTFKNFQEIPQEATIKNNGHTGNQK